MTFLTLNTNHTARLVRPPAAAMAPFRPVVAAGGGPIPRFSPFNCSVTKAPGGAVFSIHRGREPVTLCGCAWTGHAADQIWPELESTYLGLTDTVAHLGLERDGQPAVRPATLPWLAAILLPSIAVQTPEAMRRIGEIETLIAWTLLLPPA